MYFDALAKPRCTTTRRARVSRIMPNASESLRRRSRRALRPRPSPLICDFRAHGAIDPRTFLASDGNLYLDWKSDNNAAAPAAYAVSHLYAQRLSANGLSLDGPPHLLLTADERWQAKIVEAPDMVEARGGTGCFTRVRGSTAPTMASGTPAAPVRSARARTSPFTDLSSARTAKDGPRRGVAVRGARTGVVDAVLAVVLRLARQGEPPDRDRSGGVRPRPYVAAPASTAS